MPLPPPPPKKHRKPLPPGRVFFSDLAFYLGCSPATVKRRFRSPTALEEWARALDIRQRHPDGALHCAEDRVEAYLERERAELLGGALATASTGRDERFSKGGTETRRAKGGGAGGD